jgi:hypothetical protein
MGCLEKEFSVVGEEMDIQSMNVQVSKSPDVNKSN